MGRPTLPSYGIPIYSDNNYLGVLPLWKILKSPHEFTALITEKKVYALMRNVKNY